MTENYVMRGASGYGLATVAETAFTTGTGTAGQPGQLGWEGSVSINDIGTMWNL